MSEYQYYEFLALDHPLTRQQMAQVRKWSSRAEITPTRFTNHYEWGDFKGDPHKFLADWYDVFLYFANWGTKRLAISLPKGAIPLDVAKEYANDNSVQALIVGDKLILDWEYVTEDLDDDLWMEDASHAIGAAAGIREDLLRGDYRPLYLGWLLGVQLEDVDGDAPEPDLPPGLDKLSGAQAAMVDFLQIDRALIRTAAERSAKEAPSEDKLKTFIKGLPSQQKDELLWQCLQGKSVAAMAEVTTAFRQNHPLPKDKNPRHAEELWNKANAINAEEQKREAERQAAERAAHLKKFADDLPGTWEHVDTLLAARGGSKSHDEAFDLMKDLREIYEKQGNLTAFRDKMKTITAGNRKRSSLMWRFRDEGFLPEEK